MVAITSEALSLIFKAYDVRGTVPDQIDAEIVERTGAAFARFAVTDAVDSGGSAPTRVLVAHDMRPTGPEFADAFARGVNGQGIDAVLLGLCSTDELFFASGHFDAPGAMLTASHNPAQYNGIKLCLAGARPVGEETGLAIIRDDVLVGVAPASTTGSVSTDDALPAFVEHVHGFVDLDVLKPLRIVADTANGMGEILYGELDGTFPNHPADPIQPENLRDLQARVLETDADVGLAFDGDADRVFLVDDEGELVSGSLTTAIVALAMLQKNPGSTILHNVICSKTVPEVVRENGGTPLRTRVGHSFIKQVMAETGAAFGGEHSGHYYFRDNYRADSGIIAALTVLEVMSTAGEPLSQLRTPFERYAASGEINFAVDDPRAIIEVIATRYADQDQDRLDGLTVDLGDWWFNVRPSNTEPLLRLNLEAADSDACAQHVAELEALIDDAKEGR
jgi:phosphomannomutase